MKINPRVSINTIDKTTYFPKLTPTAPIDIIDKTINFPKLTPGNYEIPAFSEADVNIYYLDNKSQDYTEYSPEHQNLAEETRLRDKIIQGTGETRNINFHYQGHVYFGKTYVYTHKEKDTDEDILSYTKNVFGSVLYPFGNSYEKNGVSGISYKRVKVLNTLYPHPRRQFRIPATCCNRLELGWHPIQKRSPILHFVRKTGSILFIEKYLKEDICITLCPRIRGYPTYMQQGIGRGIPWEEICFIKYPLPTQEVKRKVKPEFSVVTRSKKIKPEIN
jgi:hypothetical protein